MILFVELVLSLIFFYLRKERRYRCVPAMQWSKNTFVLGRVHAYTGKGIVELMRARKNRAHQRGVLVLGGEMFM